MGNKNVNKIRIKLESFDYKSLNISCQKIIEKIKSTETKIVGPISLPIKKRIYCVLRSPHVNKDAREHFEIRIHSRILEIYPTTTNTVNFLVNIEIPSGVGTKIQTLLI
jgi:small subunit ribosomal protein S10